MPVDVQPGTPGASVTPVPLANSPTPTLKTADETVNNSTTLQNDDELLFAIAANEVWVAEFILFHAGDFNADIKFALTVPAGATVRYALFGGTPTGTGFVSDATATGGTGLPTGSAGAPGFGSRLFAYIANGATPGNVQLQWAQASATGVDTKLLAGSYLTRRRLSP